MRPVRSGTGLRWRKSSYSSDTANCVEVLASTAGIGVRDSKDPGGPALRYSAVSWSSFVLAVRSGEFDPGAARS